MSFFNPTDLQKTYLIVYDYCHADPVQVYLHSARIPPLCKVLKEVKAFDHGEALRKARSLYPTLSAAMDRTMEQL